MYVINHQCCISLHAASRRMCICNVLSNVMMFDEDFNKFLLARMIVLRVYRHK